MQEETTPIEFTGTGREYFGIWIVNLLLSILTLGIYSAWAKVRRKKYFYQNTLIENVGFDYHADPKAILKGRLIAMAFFFVYQLVASSNPTLGIAVFVLLLIAVPWILTRSFIFNARNSSHRGLRFDFTGRIGEAAKVFIAFPILAYITAGLAFPFVMQRVQAFMIGHHQFGTSNFQMQAKVKDFYLIYLKLFGVIVLLGIIAASFIPQLTQFIAHADAPHQTAHVHTVDAVVPSVDQGGLMKVGNTGDLSEIEAYLENLTPEERAAFEAELAKMNEADGEIAEDDAPSDDRFSDLFGNISHIGLASVATIMAGMILYLTVIFSFVAYTKSRITNLVWNHTTLDHLSFESTLRMRGLLWIYVTNIILLVLTLGLATPWAQIRATRYRLAHMHIVGETDWDAFVGEKKAQTQSMGEELAEVFDVDISF